MKGAYVRGITMLRRVRDVTDARRADLLTLLINVVVTVLNQRPNTGTNSAAMQAGSVTDVCCPGSCSRASKWRRKQRWCWKRSGTLGGLKALSYFLVTPFIISTNLPFSAQREPAIKAKMPNYAWLSTIKDGAAAKFRDRRQLRGPFSAIAELSAVIRCSSGEFRRKGEK